MTSQTQAQRSKRETRPLVGRQYELASASGLVSDVLRGSKRGLLIVGTAGIGKSTLLRVAFEMASDAGLVCAFIRAPSAGGLPPRFPIGDLLRRLARNAEARSVPIPLVLSQILDALESETGSSFPVALPQVTEALESLARNHPIALFVDDFLCLPPEGAQLLIGALRLLEAPCLLVATARLEGMAASSVSALPAPTADLWIDRAHLDGLPLEEIGELAAMQLGADVLPSLQESLHHQTAGNPLFALETLRAWHEQGCLERIGGFWGLAHRPVAAPASLQEAIAARLNSMAKRDAIVVQVLALLGRDASFDELNAIIGDPALPRHLMDLVEAGVVIESVAHSIYYRLSHPLYGTSVVMNAGATKTAALHGQIFSALQSLRQAGRRIPVAELAHHAIHALKKPAQLRELVLQAAIEAERLGSDEECARWYSHLREASDGDALVLTRALEGQARASLSFDFSTSRDLFAWCLSLTNEPTKKAQLLLGRAQANRRLGDFPQTRSDLEHAMRLASGELIFEARHASAILNALERRTDSAEKELNLLVEDTRGTASHSRALSALAHLRFTRGSLPMAVALAEQALEACVDTADARNIRTNLVWYKILSGSWKEAERLLEETREASRLAGDLWNFALDTVNAARLRSWKGQAREGLDLAAQGLRIARRLGNDTYEATALDALGIALLESGRAREAVQALSVIPELAVASAEPMEFTLTYGTFAEAHLEIGDLDRAHELLKEAHRHLPDAACYAVLLDRLHAELELAQGSAAQAFSVCRPWLDSPSAVAFEQARITEIAAKALDRMGNRDESLSIAERALATYGRLGAEGRSERLSAWVREKTPRKRGRPSSRGPGGLTPREVEVLTLIVKGKTDPQIAKLLTLSPATVRKHSENIMTKAGASRRTQLVTFALRIGVISSDD